MSRRLWNEGIVRKDFAQEQSLGLGLLFIVICTRFSNTYVMFDNQKKFNLNFYKTQIKNERQRRRRNIQGTVSV